jgi:hypothetical protein
MMNELGHCSILVDTRPPQRPKLGRELVLGQVRNTLDIFDNGTLTI